MSSKSKITDNGNNNYENLISMRYGTELQQKELKAAIKNGIIGGSVQENVYGHLFKPISRSNKREAVYNWKPDLKKKP